MIQRKILIASLTPGELNDQSIPVPLLSKFIYATYREQTKEIDLHFEAPNDFDEGKEIRIFRTFVAENVVPRDFNYLSSVSAHDITIHVYERNASIFYTKPE